MKQPKYSCAHCGAGFMNMTDHMTHVVQVHDTGYKPRGERLPRPISCWRCGTKDMISPGEGSGDWYTCECGFTLPGPDRWVNGQLTKDDKE